MRNVFGLKRAVVATAAMLALSALTAAPAMASVVVLGQSAQGAGNTAGTGFAVGYGAYQPLGASFSTDPTVFVPPGNASGVYQSPFNSNALTDARNYFSVGAESSVNGALTPVTLTFSAVQTVFNILWGSIDSYNTISFFNGATSVASYTGTDIFNLLTPGSETPNNYERVALLGFTFDGFDKVKFESSQAAFEFALAPIPLPPAILLFGSGIAGLGMLARRRKNKVNTTLALSA